MYSPGNCSRNSSTALVIRVGQIIYQELCRIHECLGVLSSLFFPIYTFFNPFAHDFFPHRAFAAFAAIWERLRGLRASALAVPPFRPPSRPSATAWGFLAGSTGLSAPGLNLGVCPVDSSMIWYA